MSPEEKEKSFDYEAHERLKKELEADGTKGLEDAEASDANEDADFEDPVISGDLPPFWKPEIVGEKRIGEVTAVRRTKDFGEGHGEAINLRGAAGLFALPISAGLVDLDWHKQIGRIFLFVFKGWYEFELPDGTKAKKRNWDVRPKRGQTLPF